MMMTLINFINSLPGAQLSQGGGGGGVPEVGTRFFILHYRCWRVQTDPLAFSLRANALVLF